MAFVTFTCAHCGLAALMQSGAYNRAQKAGLRVYCDRACSGLGRRKHKSEEQKKAEKSAYDAQRRIDLRDRLKAEKAAYYQRTKDPVKEAELRKAKMPRHVEYCRRPEYRAWKSQYDAAYRAKKDFGPFWESALLVNDLNTEVLSRQSRYEIDLENGKLNKRNNRRRDYDRQINVPKLSAVNLKGALWDTLNAIKSDSMLPAQGDAIAAQAREILRTVKVQLQVVAQAKRNVPTEIIDFVEQA